MDVPQVLVFGVLALQGAFQEHINLLSKHSLSDSIRLRVIPVKTPSDLLLCDALIIPGGESTTIALLARLSGLSEPLREFVRNPTKAVWGTCAGAILLAEKVGLGVKKGGQETFGGIGVEVERNGWGSQVESFEAPLFVDGIRDSSRPFRGVFIRAPLIRSILDPASSTPSPNSPSSGARSDPPIQVVARISPDLLPYDPVTRNDDDVTDPVDDRTIVALKQGRKLLTTFHPELTLDSRFHEYFLTDCVLAQ